MIIDKLNNKYWHIWANYGHYGIPPQFSSFAIQLSVWLTIVIFVKFITYSTQLELAIPLGSFMNYILSDLESNPKLELVVVMIIIPVNVNSLQFWLTDMVLKHDTEESTLEGGHMLPSLLSTIRSTSKSSTTGIITGTGIPSINRSLSRQPSADNKNGFRPLAASDDDDDDEEEKEYEGISNIYHNNSNTSSSSNTMIYNTTYNKIHNTSNTNHSDLNASSSSDHQYGDNDLESGQSYDPSDSLSLLRSHHQGSSLVDYRGAHTQPVNSNTRTSSPKVSMPTNTYSPSTRNRSSSNSGSSRTPPTSPAEVKNR